MDICIFAYYCVNIQKWPRMLNEHLATHAKAYSKVKSNQDLLSPLL